MVAARWWCADRHGRQPSRGGISVATLLAVCAALALDVGPLGAQVPTRRREEERDERHDEHHDDQPLHAFALNELDFGTIFPGIPKSVSASDSHHAGLFQIQGAKGASVRVELVLPSALIAEDGARLTVSFGPRDGLADFHGDRAPHGLSFDPQAPVIGTLAENGKAYLRIGGTVLPARPQSGGTYRATIFLTVYDLGT